MRVNPLDRSPFIGDRKPRVEKLPEKDTRKHKHLSEFEKELIRGYHAKGDSVADLAEMFKTNIKHIKNILAENA